MRIQYVAAVLALFIAGATWGDSNTVSVTECVLGANPKGNIVRVQNREPSRSQYVLITNEGCSILVTTTRFPELSSGGLISIEGDIEAVSKIPAEYEGFADYLDRQEIDATSRYPQVTLLNEPAFAINTAHDRAHTLVDKLYLEPEGSVVRAMLLADRGMIPAETTERFRRIGVSHILAISGLHISIMVGMLLLIFLQIPIPAWLRTTLLISLLWMYVWFIGFPVSSVRASLFWSIGLIAFQIRSLISLPTTVLLAVVALVTYDPRLVSDVAFQLSFAAVGGIGLAAFLLQGRNLLSKTLIISFGAAVATLPIVSYHFALVSIVGLIGNVLIVPVVPIFLVLALITLVVGSVSSVAGLLGVGMSRLVWMYIDGVAVMLDALPYASVDYEISSWMVFVWFGAWLFACIYIMKRNNKSLIEIWEP